MVKYYFQSMNGSLSFVHAGTKEELEEEFEPVKGNKLYDDIDWVCELAELFKGK